MSQYEIKRWDVVMTGSNTFKSPILYIKPDLDFLEFARVNDFALMAVVDGTGLQYDGHQIPAVINKGCTVPNCLPNLSEATGYYVVVLDSNWYGYPKDGKLGTVSFLGLVKQGSNLNNENGEVVNDKGSVINNNSEGMRSFSLSSSDGRARSVSNKDWRNNIDLKKRNFIIIIGLIVLFILILWLTNMLCED